MPCIEPIAEGVVVSILKRVSAIQAAVLSGCTYTVPSAMPTASVVVVDPRGTIISRIAR